MNIIQKLTNNVDYMIEDFSAPIYRLLILLMYLIYIISAIGIAYINPNYTDYLNHVIKIFIALVLIIRFNPFRNTLNCNKNDRTFILASCFFLLTSEGFIEYLKLIFEKYFSLKY